MPDQIKRAALPLQKEYHAPLFTAHEPGEAFSSLVTDYTCNHANFQDSVKHCKTHFHIYWGIIEK